MMKSTNQIKGFALFTLITFFVLLAKSNIEDPVLIIEEYPNFQANSLGYTNSTPWSYTYTDNYCDIRFCYEAQFGSYTHNHLSYWEILTPQIIKIIQSDLKDHVEKISILPPPDIKGRGIVFSTSSKGLRMVSISIKFIRSYGCTLPVEIWHNNELSIKEIEKIESLGNVQARNTKDFNMELTDSHEFTVFDYRLYSMKGAALILSRFDEILLLDADNVPARDPSFLFESDPFKETGALFWKDYWMTRCDNPIFKILELECIDENQQESGQLVIKKSSPGVLMALRLAFYMQQRVDVYSRLIHGDKDTFRFAWRYLNLPYHMVLYI